MKYPQETLTEIYRALGTDPANGLTEQQITEIQREKGFNRFEEGKKETLARRVLHHLRDITPPTPASSRASTSRWRSPS